MKKYLIIDYSGIDDNLDFHILGTEHERGTPEFEELIEGYETNNNCILVKEITDIEQLQDDLAYLCRELGRLNLQMLTT